MKFSGRQILLGLLALGALMLLTILAAPSGEAQYLGGSTFGRAPNGYGAWYAKMERQGATVQRWQQSLQTFLDSIQPPATLLRVNPNRFSWGLSEQVEAWVRQGNTLVLLGVVAPVTEAPFTTWHTSDVGQIRIDTQRRHPLRSPQEQLILGDAFGAIVWQESLGQGRVVRSVTPYLAGNAYQEPPGNHALLTELVTQSDGAIWVDEYLHGFKDPEVVVEESGVETWIDYLAQTPWLLVLAQACVLLVVLLWAYNRRFGPPVALATPTLNNSEAYIQALSEVLRKAESHQFVVDVVSQAERLQVQQALGLGKQPVDESLLLQTWAQKTGRPPQELKDALFPKSGRQSQEDLEAWLEKVQTVHQYL